MAKNGELVTPVTLERGKQNEKNLRRRQQLQQQKAKIHERLLRKKQKRQLQKKKISQQPLRQLYKKRQQKKKVQERHLRRSRRLRLVQHLAQRKAELKSVQEYGRALVDFSGLKDALNDIDQVPGNTGEWNSISVADQEIFSTADRKNCYCNSGPINSGYGKKLVRVHKIKKKRSTTSNLGRDKQGKAKDKGISSKIENNIHSSNHDDYTQNSKAEQNNFISVDNGNPDKETLNNELQRKKSKSTMSRRRKSIVFHREIKNFNRIIQTPAFLENPFDSIRRHIYNVQELYRTSYSPV